VILNMRRVIQLSLILLVFGGCAFVGYLLAPKVPPPKDKNQGVGPDGVASIPQVEQHNFMFVRVDDMRIEKPRLISVWYVSLFIVNNDPSSLTLAQIYPPRVPSPKSVTLSRAFSISAEHDPVPAFWNSLTKQYGFNWEGYVMYDTDGANLLLQWLVGPNDFQGALDEAAKSPDNSRAMAQQTCQSITDSSGRSIGQFDWGQVVPDHFRTSLRLETGLAYWDRMTKKGHPVTCEFLP
jgi:hypothetical protein